MIGGRGCCMMRTMTRCPHYHNKMRKLIVWLIWSVLCPAMIALSGCAKEAKPNEYHTSVLERLPFVYKMTVQQGNVITDEQVAQLQPGMNKRQVTYLLGTPLLTDFFNTDRWDYVYTLRRGHKPEERRKLTVFFKDDALVRTDGDLRPTAGPAAALTPKEMVVSVPDYQDHKGLFGRAWETIGSGRGK
jgi:outer membrane protein assembly factor BamE